MGNLFVPEYLFLVSNYLCVFGTNVTVRLQGRLGSYFRVWLRQLGIPVSLTRTSFRQSNGEEVVEEELMLLCILGVELLKKDWNTCFEFEVP
ncbi:hypothetical protein Patl1_18125 [Pistacia atlantica]|uniref:Uncharacterized protein n=1 Tax=Pistacia atlantica TaxID=434234 RepID=A0ACC1C3A9_9ROSI|nr:hypothetical protein Patl1_18125 [Pistacia atlantica]